MNGLLPSVVELGCLLLVALCAAALARALRKPPEATDKVDGRVPDLGFAAAAPLLVIGLSWLAYAAAERAGLADSLPAGWPAHRKAWLIFWGVVLAVRLAESVAGSLYRRRGRPIPIPDLLRSLLRAAAYVAASFLVLHRVVGMNITPLLTSTALLTAVVGFALQGVLGNLLAGMSLHLVRSLVPGDWVAVGDAEGQVVETNWRETRLRTVAGHMLIVPNSKVAESVLHNMSQPTALRRHKLDVGASYSDPPELVVRTLEEAARSVPEVLADPPPSAYVTEFKDFGINYRLRFWTRTYHDRTPTEGHVGRMIWYQFKRRGIEIPFPMSDKLLSDFMEVVYKQKTQPPADSGLERRTEDLMRSDFVRGTLVGRDGSPLVTRKEVRSLAGTLRHLPFTRGETVFRQGESGESCYVLVRGRLRGEILREGAPEAAGFDVEPGAVIGEMSLFTGLPRSGTVRCAEEAELLEIPREAFAALLALRSEIPEVLSHLVAERAAANAASIEQLKSRHDTNAAPPLRRESILQRFLHLLQRHPREEQSPTA